MNFKVGDKVWIIIGKKYATITAIDEADDYTTYIRLNIDNDDFEGCWQFDYNLHETAQTMFERLGYDYFEDGDHADYYINNEKGLTIELRTYVKEFVKFNSKDKKRRGIDLEELQAIIQYYVEKGWIE